MSKRSIIPFDVTGWDQSPHEGDGPLHSSATVTKAFRGDLTGESTARLLMCQADVKDLAAGAGYVASETVTGTLDGRGGTFVMGITGTVEISVDGDGGHSLILEYDLP